MILQWLKMETQNEIIRKKARQGIKIYSDFISKKYAKSEYYNYECLAAINEFSLYDLQVQKHDKEDYGDYSTVYVEIKMRDDNVSYTDYDTSVIDAYKITNLQKLAYITDCRVFVAVIYPKDKKILQWEIEADEQYNTDNKEVIWKSKSLSEGEIYKLQKCLVHLPISQAKIYNYQ